MHALRSLRNVLAGLGLAAFMIGFMPRPATARPAFPVTRNTYKLFARAISYINVNRVFMGVNAIGEVGNDSGSATNNGGGFWPRGTPDQYIFNAGLQVAGVVAGVKSPANPWGGDTAGGWFFDGSGGRVETEGVTQAWQSFNAADAANWPADAFVPQGDDVANLYAKPLQGLVAASQGDVHFISWEGNPAFNVGRLHPLGILVDYRLLAWNYPAGAQDIVFLVATVYNVTSANCGDYAAHRPGIRTILCQQGQKFQSLNNAKFGIALPAGGYSVINTFMAVAGDNDVGNAGSNMNGVNLPFAMGYTYEAQFGNTDPGWKFDPSIFGPPFFAGVGFVGYKYLKGPDGPGAIQLYSTFCNGVAVCGAGHSDPGSMIINYRLLAGTPAATDGQCNVTAPGKTAADIHVCFMLLGATGADTRMTESSTPLTLAPGQAKSIVVAFVFAAPVAVPGFVPTTAAHDPGNVTWSNSTDSMFKYNASGSPGLNLIDSISGFVKYNGPHFNTDGSVHQPVQSEFSVVKGSLLGKALVAQAVFDVKFLQEFAPDAPQFFLIPGDKQVTILWKPSATETIGDPYFQIVKSPTAVSSTGLTIANPLYDPNYRQFDVEGYRIYRGRSDSPSALKLLVQFDYAGTMIKDFTGFVVNGNCAPEVGVLTDCPETTPPGGFPTPANPTPPQTAATRFVSYNIGPQADVSPLQFVDQTGGTRLALAGGATSFASLVDTVVSGGGSGFPALKDNGVPFIFIDVAGATGCTGCGPNNGANYYYSVTAFDVNAPGHGPTSLESARVTKQVTPQATAVNFSNANSTSSGVFGRHGLLTDVVVPALDATTGEFSKAFPPTNAATLALAGFAPALLNGSGAVGLTFDSIVVNSLDPNNSLAQTDYYSLTNSTGTTHVTIPFTINQVSAATSTANGNFTAFAVDSTLAARFAGGLAAGSGYSIAAAYSVTHNDASVQGVQGRGCANGVPGGSDVNGNNVTGGSCYYNGARWFSGTNESTANPTTSSPSAFGGTGTTTVYGNAGSLPGVVYANSPNGYGWFNGGGAWRNVEFVISPFITAADYKLYWGTAGKVDSVIDVTHDQLVPFKTTMGSSWGILNSNSVTPAGGFDGRAEFTVADFSCVGGIKQFATGGPTCPGPQVPLVNTAVPGPIAIGFGAVTKLKTVAAEPNNGFGIYLHGRLFLFELRGGALPAAGTVWTMRDYTGSVYGGNGPGGNLGAYQFVSALRPATTSGTQVQFKFTVANALIATTPDSLARVHTVPDPYYVTSAYDIAVNAKDIQFVHVPTGAIIRIYSSSGVLIRVLQNTTTTFGGIVHWNVRNRTNQFVSSGVYFYNVEADGISRTGRMTIVNYASTVQ